MLVACFGMCCWLSSGLSVLLSECTGRLFRIVLVVVLGFVFSIVGMYWSRVSECVSRCVRICPLSECIGRVVRSVLVAVLGFVLCIVGMYWSRVSK